MIEPRGIYYYFHAYIKYDYFQRKGYRTSPTWNELLETAKAKGVSALDKSQLFEILGVAKPGEFF